MVHRWTSDLPVKGCRCFPPFSARYSLPPILKGVGKCILVCHHRFFQETPTNFLIPRFLWAKYTCMSQRYCLAYGLVDKSRLFIPSNPIVWRLRSTPRRSGIVTGDILIMPWSSNGTSLVFRFAGQTLSIKFSFFCPVFSPSDSQGDRQVHSGMSSSISLSLILKFSRQLLTNQTLNPSHCRFLVLLQISNCCSIISGHFKSLA